MVCCSLLYASLTFRILWRSKGVRHPPTKNTHAHTHTQLDTHTHTHVRRHTRQTDTLTHSLTHPPTHSLTHIHTHTHTFTHTLLTVRSYWNAHLEHQMITRRLFRDAIRPRRIMIQIRTKALSSPGCVTAKLHLDEN